MLGTMAGENGVHCTARFPKMDGNRPPRRTCRGHCRIGSGARRHHSSCKGRHCPSRRPTFRRQSTLLPGIYFQKAKRRSPKTCPDGCSRRPDRSTIEHDFLWEQGPEWIRPSHRDSNGRANRDRTGGPPARLAPRPVPGQPMSRSEQCRWGEKNGAQRYSRQGIRP